ncbi:MAG: Na+/H+ antiporter subunit E [Phycisphaerales bacterium]
MTRMTRLTNSTHSTGAAPPPRPGVAAGLRAVVFLVFWLLLTGADRADLATGLVAPAVATGTSPPLPPRRGRVRLAGLARLAVHFARQSVVAGLDVARRAFDPRLPLKPGFVAHRLRVPRGAARNAFTAMTSLMPGTVPVGFESPAGPGGLGGLSERGAHDVLTYHCLDVDQPVASQLTIDEAMFTRAIGAARSPGASDAPTDARP